MKIEKKVTGIMERVELLDAGEAFLYQGVLYLVVDKGEVNVGSDPGILVLNMAEDRIEFFESPEKVEVIEVSINIMDKKVDRRPCGGHCHRHPSDWKPGDKDPNYPELIVPDKKDEEDSVEPVTPIVPQNPEDGEGEDEI